MDIFIALASFTLFLIGEVVLYDSAKNLSPIEMIIAFMFGYVGFICAAMRFGHAYQLGGIGILVSVAVTFAAVIQIDKPAEITDAEFERLYK